MDTKVIKINPINPENDKIEYAARFLRDGGLVSFPTETVYGLGTNALNESAVKKIFKAKGRPSDNPLIVHVSDMDNVLNLVSQIPHKATKLMEAFWPGPLTIVFKKSSIVPDIITGGLDTVAVRMPSHPIALQLIRASGVPVAAPSANVSGKPSSTLAKHVVEDLCGKVDVIIDGGPCEVGLESTVIDLTENIPMLLRPGGITYNQLVDIIGDIIIDSGVADNLHNDVIPRSPGMKYKHYSPKAELIVIEGDEKNIAKFINIKANEYKENGYKVGFLALNNTKIDYAVDKVIFIGDSDKPETIAANLFSGLREMDEAGIDVIYAQAIDDEGIGMAVRNRLFKAAGYNILKVGE